MPTLVNVPIKSRPVLRTSSSENCQNNGYEYAATSMNDVQKNSDVDNESSVPRKPSMSQKGHISHCATGLDDENGLSHANTSNEELNSNRHWQSSNQSRIMNDEQEDNSQTLSGSMLETALQDLIQRSERQDRSTSTPPKVANNNYDNDNDETVVTSFSQLQQTPKPLANYTEHQPHRSSSKQYDIRSSFESLSISPSIDSPTTTRHQVRMSLPTEMGPHETLYREQYQGYVQSKIAAWKHTEQQHNTAIREYASMTDIEKQREQERVMKLLARLKIGQHGDYSVQEATLAATKSIEDSGDDEQNITQDKDLSNSDFQKQGSRKPRYGDSDWERGSHRTTFSASPLLRSSLESPPRSSLRTSKLSHDTQGIRLGSTSTPSRSVSFAAGTVDYTSERAMTNRSEYTTSRSMISRNMSSRPNESEVPQFKQDTGDQYCPDEGMDDFFADDGDDLVEESMVLMSPPQEMAEENSPRFRENSSVLSDSIASDVEMPRFATNTCYDSPAVLRRDRKRLASTSGKRGSDLVRSRSHDGPSMPPSIPSPIASPEKATEFMYNDLASQNKLDYSPAQIIAMGGHSCDTVDGHCFSASQSPIHARSRDQRTPNNISAPLRATIQSGMSTPSSSLSSTSYGRETGLSPHRDFKTSFSEDSIVNTTLYHRRGLNRPGDAAIALKPGAKCHFNPLQVQRSQHRSEASLLDPFNRYSSKIARRLEEVRRMIARTEEASRTPGDLSAGKAIVLSLEDDHIRAVTLKLLLESESPIRYSQVSGTSQSPNVKGSTLIITRDRHDLEDWSRLFREGSAFSVLNHPSLPVKERKSLSTAHLSARYDVVLSTFDALKSHDITLQADSSGLILQENEEDGWYSSKAESTAGSNRSSCVQVSVLHYLSWKRVIMVDTIGRKCYLVKKGASRPKAASHLISNSRYEQEQVSLWILRS